MDEFIIWCDYLGTAAFAISGIRLAAANRFDWFGAYVVGFFTACGGGTLRDLLLGVTPFWMLHPSYLIVTGISLFITILFSRKLVRLNNTVFFFDAIGLGLFTVVGMAKTLGMGFPWWVAILMGTITGSFGGMMRDIIINQVPLIFREDIYALACVVGGVVYAVLLLQFDMPTGLIQAIAAVVVVLTRFLAVHFHVSVPKFKDDQAHI